MSGGGEGGRDENLPFVYNFISLITNIFTSINA